MKYNLLNQVTGEPCEGMTIDETAKEDFMELMNWKEDDWNKKTEVVEEHLDGKFDLSEGVIGLSPFETIRVARVKPFIERRIMEATKLIALFNQDKLTSMNLREHRQHIKDDAGDKFI